MTDGARSAQDLLLGEDEVDLLCRGLLEWSGPARCTEEFAVAMGFPSADQVSHCTLRLRAVLADGAPLEPLDWARVLVAVELAFVSDVVGSGFEWSTTTGLSDLDTIRLLRGIQRKLVHIVAPIVGEGFGTRPGRN